MQDSNLRPTAPEGGGHLNDPAQIDPNGQGLVKLRELAIDVLERIAAGDPQAHAVATRLAAAVLAATRVAKAQSEVG